MTDTRNEPGPSESAGRPALRARLAEDAARLYDTKIQAFIEEALSAERTAWG